MFEAHLEDYAIMVQQCGENTDLMLELLGTMVYIPSDHWEIVIDKTNFINLKMWFDNDEDSITLYSNIYNYKDHENFNRVQKLKEIIFDLNKGSHVIKLFKKGIN